MEAETLADRPLRPRTPGFSSTLMRFRRVVSPYRPRTVSIFRDFFKEMDAIEHEERPDSVMEGQTLLH